jgi:hypothetical protein
MENKSDDNLHNPQELDLPRWIQVPAGLFLSVILLPCLAGSLMMVFLPNEKAPLLAPTAGILMSQIEEERKIYFNLSIIELRPLAKTLQKSS